MKTNYFKFLSVLVVVCCISVGFAACSDDDESSSDSPEKLLIGKWQPTKVMDENVANSSMFSVMKDDVLEIKSGNIVTYDENGTYYISQNYYPSKSTWSISYESTLLKTWVINFQGKGVFFFKEDFFIEKVDETTLIINNGVDYEFKRIQ